MLKRFIAIFLGVALFGSSLPAADPPASVPPGEIAGIVTDENGQPLEDVLVDAWTWYPGHETRTDKAGRYHLKNLGPRGNVEIRFSKEGFGPFYKEQQQTGVAILNVTLNNRTYLEGHVFSPAGVPVPNALVRADSGPKEGDGVRITSVWTETTSDANGAYRLYLMPDRYDLQVRVPGVGVLRQESTVVSDGQPAKMDLQLERGITFKVRFINSETKAAVAGAKISNWRFKGIEATSDADGMAIIQDMQPGNFQVEINADGFAQWWSENAVNQWEKTLQDRGSFNPLTFNIVRDMTPVTIMIQAGVIITGHVFDPHGNPVDGATVAPARTGTGNSITGDTRFSVPTSGDGSFTMILPASGAARHNLIVHDGKFGQTRTWANGVGEPMHTSPGQRIDNVKLMLTASSTVKGRVVDADGIGIADREVRAVSTDGLDNRYFVPSTRTDKDGNYELKFVRPGEMMIQISPFQLNPALARGGTSHTITFTPGSIKEQVDFTAPPAR